jgi:hypothetical protein
MKFGQQLECLHLYDIRVEEQDNSHSRQQWKLFAKKIGQQLIYLSIGGLTAMDVNDVDILLKYCDKLIELKISNEIDIISYLAIIRQQIRRIFINCEHGVGLECLQILALRNDAEKVIHLGLVLGFVS